MHVLFDKCEDEFRKLVRELWNYKCLVCGKNGTDVHHWAFRRNVHLFCHDPRNAVFLCRKHHDEADMDQSAAVEDRLSTMETGKLMLLWRDHVRVQANKQFGGIDYEKRLEILHKARIINAIDGYGLFHVWIETNKLS
jgi:hypothetical protein